MHTRLHRNFAAGLALLLAAAIGQPAGAEDPKDLLFYGNSFTIAVGFGSSRNVPELVRDIATAAGRPTPRIRNAASAGQSLQWHLTNNTAVISTGVTPGEKWDAVVLQDFSTQPTTIGNLALHLSSSLALYQQVAAHSPGVVPVMFETWARGPGHTFYVPPVVEFPGGPAQMQQQVRDGYLMSTANINTVVGSNIARYAPVGDAWEDGGFPLNFYASDRYHAANRGTLLTSLVLYGVIYGDISTSDIDLTGVLSSLNLNAADGLQLTSLADGVLVPEPASVALLLIGVLGVSAQRAWRARA